MNCIVDAFPFNGLLVHGYFLGGSSYSLKTTLRLQGMNEVRRHILHHTVRRLVYNSRSQVFLLYDSIIMPGIVEEFVTCAAETFDPRKGDGRRRLIGCRLIRWIIGTWTCAKHLSRISHHKAPPPPPHIPRIGCRQNSSGDSYISSADVLWVCKGHSF